MKYIVYETTNLINGKFYIGFHNNKKEYYLGSGLLLKKAIKKYGYNNFIRETLKIFDNKKDASEFERLIVNNVLVNSKNCYNLREGGCGGCIGYGINHPCYKSKLSDEIRNKISISSKGRIFSKQHRKNMSSNHHKSTLWFIYGKMFNSSREAGLFYGVGHQTILNWCNRYKIPHCYSIYKDK